jgi:hypothetical protein
LKEMRTEFQVSIRGPFEILSRSIREWLIRSSSLHSWCVENKDVPLRTS